MTTLGPIGRWPQLLESLKLGEGLRLTAYRDTVGKLTVGYGHNLDAKPLAWLRTGVPIPKRVAEVILAQDVDDALRSLDQFIPWWRDLDDVREQAIAELAFNMGVDDDPRSGLDSFINTLKAIQGGRWQVAYDGLTSSKWARQVGRDRSERIAGMILTGLA